MAACPTYVDYREKTVKANNDAVLFLCCAVVYSLNKKSIRDAAGNSRVVVVCVVALFLHGDGDSDPLTLSPHSFSIHFISYFFLLPVSSHSLVQKRAHVHKTTDRDDPDVDSAK